MVEPCSAVLRIDGTDVEYRCHSPKHDLAKHVHVGNGWTATWYDVNHAVFLTENTAGYRALGEDKT